MATEDPGKLSGILGKMIGAAKGTVAGMVGSDDMKARASMDYNLGEAELRAVHIKEQEESISQCEKERDRLIDLKNKTEEQRNEAIFEAAKIADTLDHQAEDREKNNLPRDQTKFIGSKISEIEPVATYFDALNVAPHYESENDSASSEASPTPGKTALEKAKEVVMETIEVASGRVDADSDDQRLEKVVEIYSID